MTKQQFNDSVNQEVKRLTQQGERKYCEETPPTKANDATNETRERFVILEGIEHHNRFFTMYSGGDPTKSDTGGTWYKILGYADTVSEAQIKLYGRDFPLPVSEHTSGLPRTPIQKQLTWPSIEEQQAYWTDKCCENCTEIDRRISQQGETWDEKREHDRDLEHESRVDYASWETDQE